ncbi:MAG: hypothetical protein AMXMBFR82_43490 [Candidatus Hydrogenedentota bacterium]
MKLAHILALLATTLGSLTVWGSENASEEKPGQAPSDKGASTHQKADRSSAFSRIDADANGSVSLHELQKVYPRVTEDRFSALDTSGDGVLDRREAMKAAERTATDVRERFRHADANGDGQVTYEELRSSNPGVSAARFKQMDRNRDGVLSPTDRQPAQKGNDLARNETRGSRNDAARKLMESDGDGDGAVTFEEVVKAKPGFPRDAFDRYDTTKDGVITSDDYSSRQN